MSDVGTARVFDAAAPWRSRIRPGAAASLVVLLSISVVALLAFLDGARMRTQAQLGRVAFGKPLAWVVQSQSIDPPLPHTTRVMSPWENPTSIHWVPLLIDLILVGAVVATGYLSLRAHRSAGGPEGRS